MEIDLWWLLALPAFFAFGWAAARVDIRHLVSQSRALPASYFRGLNFLLNEEPDKAIDAFIEVVKVDPETIELHFALGNLFRRRGEIDRAIRMHSNLVNRPDLDEGDRLHALYELGQDYLKSGLLDRAEEALDKLAGTAYAARARRFLLDIYQLEKDWPRAIAAARAIEADGGESLQGQIAQFHCEAAARLVAQSRPEEAVAAARAALAANRKAVRASMILGDIAAAAGRHEEAIERWRAIESQDPAYLSLVAPRFVESYRALGRVREGLALVAGYLAQYPSAELLETVFDLKVAEDGPEPAYRMVRDELRRNPTLSGLDKLLEAQVMLAGPERQADLQLVKGLVHAHARRLSRYTCENCGFKARQYFWRCPGCGAWESYPPRRAEEVGHPA
ncbi:MAG: lipopolysaccharide assembly protein LapB [Burkholderiales bacterium]|nr:lipopolysaccharide assembly protein LapB [Burkholderiales bacterium]